MQRKSQFSSIIGSALQENGEEKGKWMWIDFEMLKWHQTKVASVHSNCSPFRGSSPSLELNQSPIPSNSFVLCGSSHLFLPVALWGGRAVSPSCSWRSEATRSRRSRGLELKAVWFQPQVLKTSFRPFPESLLATLPPCCPPTCAVWPTAPDPLFFVHLYVLWHLVPVQPLLALRTHFWPPSHFYFSLHEPFNSDLSPVPWLPILINLR